MRKTLSVALAALTLAGGALTATGADARDHGGHYGGGHYGGSRYYGGGHYYRGHNNDGAAVVAGIAGLAIGAAIAGGGHDRYYDNGYSRRGYYDQPYYGGGYYAPGYAYGYGPPRRCRTFTQWDPYADAYIRRTNCW